LPVNCGTALHMNNKGKCIPPPSPFRIGDMKNLIYY
jgi:hypothetical protein